MEIMYGNFIWKLNMEIIYGNYIWKFHGFPGARHMGGPGTRATRYERQTSANKNTPWKKVIGPTKSGSGVQKMDIYIYIYI